MVVVVVVCVCVCVGGGGGGPASLKRCLLVGTPLPSCGDTSTCALQQENTVD